jgi:hypothetical protein
VRSSGADLELDTLVASTARGRSTSASLPPEQRRILELTVSPLSVAEISAHLHLHLGIARVLVSDLVADEFVIVSERSGDGAGPDLPTLERLLDDLQAL